MKNFLQKLYALFFEEEAQKPVFPLGAFPNDPDNRDIPYGAVAGIPQAVSQIINVPNFLSTARLLQGDLGTCVEYALEFTRRVDDGIVHSRRVPYVITRNFLGWTEANGQGLPQRDAAKVAATVGTPRDTGLDDNTLSHSLYTSLAITHDMRNEANLYRFGGFAFPSISIDGIKQALSNGKLVVVTIAIDWNKIDSDGTVHPPKNLAGFHEVVIGQSDDIHGRFRFANWWGAEWGTNSDGFINYTELASVIFDAIVFVDISEDLKQRAKNSLYIFNSDLKQPMNSTAVAQLQTRMTAYGLYTGGIDRDFGPKTLQAVLSYQKLKGLQADGKVGPMTRLELNTDDGNIVTQLKSKLDLWCQYATLMEGAKPSRNNPGNLRYVGQKFAKNDGGFCKFDTYQHGYDALKNLFIDACSGLSRIYNPNGTLYDFYQKYAPESDGNNPTHYAEFVAHGIGVDPSVQIKTLLI